MLFVAPTATRDPDTSKHMCDYRCAFTSTQSNWAGKATAECWKYTKPWAFVRCDACPDGPVHRCTECYTKYGTTMRRRIPEIEKHQGAKCVTRPELEALLNVNFRQLASGEAAAGHQLLEYVSEVELKGGKRVHVWRWRSRCPCCYDFKVPEIKPAMPADFPRREVDVRDDVTMVVQAPILDNVTGMVQAAHGAVEWCASSRWRPRSAAKRSAPSAFELPILPQGLAAAGVARRLAAHRAALDAGPLGWLGGRGAQGALAHRVAHAGWRG